MPPNEATRPHQPPHLQYTIGYDSVSSPKASLPPREVYRHVPIVEDQPERNQPESDENQIDLAGRIDDVEAKEQKENGAYRPKEDTY